MLIFFSQVRDHCHVTGVFRGPAHEKCNWRLRQTFTIPVILHNFRGYDSHLIVRALGRYTRREITVVPQGLEKYLSLKWGRHIVFKDSLQFLSASLATLVENLKQSGADKFKYLASEFTPEQLPHLLRKGVYPYDWVDDWAKLDEPALPSREHFSNQLTGSECSEADYEHAQAVFTRFNCQTVRDYLDIYLKCDVLLLADVFEAFRASCMKHYELDPAHYLSAPGFSWDAMLKKTKVHLELLSDASIFNFLERGMRGGVCMISKRFAHANNKDMKPLDLSKPEEASMQYNPAKPSTYIMYLDANNLYGWAMSQQLP